MLDFAQSLSFPESAPALIRHDLGEGIPDAVADADLVTMNFFLHQVDDPLLFLENVRSRLSRRGLIWIYDWARKPLPEYLAFWQADEELPSPQRPGPPSSLPARHGVEGFGAGDAIGIGHGGRRVDAEADDARLDGHDLDADAEGRENDLFIGATGENEHARVSFPGGHSAKVVAGRNTSGADRELPFGPYLSMAALALTLSWPVLWPEWAGPFVFQPLRIVLDFLTGRDG